MTYIDEATKTGNYYYGVKAQSYSLALSEGVSAQVDSNFNLGKISLGEIEKCSSYRQCFLPRSNQHKMG